MPVTDPSRCAVCHADLATPATSVRCPGCGTALHAECGAELGRCPTLGCADPTLGAGRAAGSATPIGAPVSRPWTWALLGLALPAVAFSFDAVLLANPLAWGLGSFVGGEPEWAASVFGPRALLVDGLVVLSALGLVLLLARRQRQALPLLTLGVAVGAAHGVAFLPLLPLSLLGAIFLIGLLGFAPYVTTWVYVGALRHTRRVLSTPRKDEPPPAVPWWSAPWLALALGAAAGAGALLLPRPAFPYPAPAARRLAQAGVGPVELEALRRWAATVEGTAGWLDVAAAPAGCGDLWRGARVGAARGFVQWGWDDHPAYPYGYSLVVLPPGVDVPPLQGTCVRHVEVAPGAWSLYVLKTPPRTSPLFVRLPAALTGE